MSPPPNWGHCFTLVRNLFFTVAVALAYTLTNRIACQPVTTAGKPVSDDIGTPCSRADLLEYVFHGNTNYRAFTCFYRTCRTA